MQSVVNVFLADTNAGHNLHLHLYLLQINNGSHVVSNVVLGAFHCDRRLCNT